VVIAQISGALLISALVVIVRPDLGGLRDVTWALAPNALLVAAAYALLYRGLQLGPIAVVSPVLATYAVIPVLLAVWLLGESLGRLQAVGVVVTIVGAVVTSTDLRAIREGRLRRPEGLPWAIASMLLFGVATYVTGWAAQRAGWLASLWFGRLCAVAVFVVAAGFLRVRRRRGEWGERVPPGAWLAAVVGLVDVLGTTFYVVGAEVGLISIVTAVSATYPLIPVLGGVVLLHERPALTQYVGVVMVVAGLALLAA
jgi:drug/metabolite transporter (DMT)-like permease